MRRLISDTIEHTIALKLLNNDYSKGDIVKVGLNDGELAFNIATEMAPSSSTQ